MLAPASSLHTEAPPATAATPPGRPVRWRRTSCRVHFRSCPYDEAAAAWHGEERARLEALSRPASLVDGQIAAIAHVNGLVLATTNAKDFARFKGLTVETWSKR